jgi:hypothetical protein
MEPAIQFNICEITFQPYGSEKNKPIKKKKTKDKR